MSNLDKRFDRLDQRTVQTIMLDEITGRLKDQNERESPSNLPLFQAGAIENSSVTVWTDLLSLKIDSDEEVYISNIYIVFSTGDNQQLRMISNNVELTNYTPMEGFIMMLFMPNTLKFTTADKRPFVIQYKTDGVVGHEFSGEAQIMGIRKKIKKAP